MAVSFFTEGIDMPDINKTDIRNWVKNVAELHSKRLGPVSYIFCDDNKILEVNKQFLQHDYYTDIITFDYTEGDKISGDLFISLDTVRTNAEQFGQKECRLHNAHCGVFGSCAHASVICLHTASNPISIGFALI